MHDAAEAGSAEIVDILMKAGAMNVEDDSGVTPLMCAALAGHVDAVRMLKEIATEQETRDAFKVGPNTSLAFLRRKNNFIRLRLAEKSSHEIGDEEETSRECIFLQLYGATLVDKKMDLTAAVRAWFESLTFGVSTSTHITSPVYEDMPELDSADDLYRIMGDPDAIRMQVNSRD